MRTIGFVEHRQDRIDRQGVGYAVEDESEVLALQEAVVFEAVDVCFDPPLFGSDHLKDRGARLYVFTLADEALADITVVGCRDRAFVDSDAGRFDTGVGVQQFGLQPRSIRVALVIELLRDVVLLTPLVYLYLRSYITTPLFRRKVE